MTPFNPHHAGSRSGECIHSDIIPPTGQEHFENRIIFPRSALFRLKLQSSQSFRMFAQSGKAVFRFAAPLPFPYRGQRKLRLCKYVIESNHRSLVTICVVRAGRRQRTVEVNWLESYRHPLSVLFTWLTVHLAWLKKTFLNLLSYLLYYLLSMILPCFFFPFFVLFYCCLEFVFLFIFLSFMF